MQNLMSHIFEDSPTSPDATVGRPLAPCGQEHEHEGDQPAVYQQVRGLVPIQLARESNAKYLDVLIR